MLRTPGEVMGVGPTHGHVPLLGRRGEQRLGEAPAVGCPAPQREEHDVLVGHVHRVHPQDGAKVSQHVVALAHGVRPYPRERVGQFVYRDGCTHASASPR